MTVRLALAGDTALGGTLAGRSVDELVEASVDVARLLQSAQLRFVSLDCAIGRTGEPVHPEEYVIDCDEDHLGLLQRWGVDVVNVANNHSTDRGRQALLRGCGALRDRGMQPVGAGADLADATRLVVTTVEGFTVGWLAAASTHPWVGSVAATETEPGVAPLEDRDLLGEIREAATQVDALVVSVHWGKEFIAVPPPAIVETARSMIDAGARVVAGHHPHVIQPVEQWRDGVICYSLGNFCFPDHPGQGLRFDQRAGESLVVFVEMDRDGARLESITPVGYEEVGRVARLPAPRATPILERIEADAAALGTPAGERAWQRAVRTHEMQRLRRVFREEVIAAGWRGGTSRLLRLGRKNLKSVGRSLGEIIGGGDR